MNENVIPEFMHQGIRELIHELVEKNYKQLEVDGRSGKLMAKDIETIIMQYGRQLIDLPNNGFNVSGSGCVLIKGTNNQWNIDLPLWTLEEGQSDLYIFLHCRKTPSTKLVFEITDLYVP